MDKDLKWKMSEPFTIFSEKYGQMVCPGIVMLPCGDLIVTCSKDGDNGFARTRSFRSHDKGITWVEDTLYDEFLPVKNYVVIDNKIVRIYGEAANIKGSSPEKFIYLYCESNDGGRSFSEIRSGFFCLPALGDSVDTEPIGRKWGEIGLLDKIIWRRALLEAAGWHQKDWLMAKLRLVPLSPRSFIRLKNGSLLSFSSECISKIKHNPANWEQSLIANISYDNGLTWEQYSIAVPYEAENFPCEGVKFAENIPVTGEHGYYEASAVLLDDGRIYVIMRAGGGGMPLMHIWSSDEGKTWTRVKPIGTHIIGVFPKLLKLHDGSLALCCGRPGMYVFFDPSGTGDGWMTDDYFDLTDGESITLETNARPFINRLNCYKIITHVNAPLETLEWVKPEVLSANFYSWENVDICEISSGRILAVYDLQNWIENPGASHLNAIRGVWIEK